MSTGYITLTRQSGLLKEMDVIANNIANISTNGFRKEGVIFSEYVSGGKTQGSESISMAFGNIRNTDFRQGGFTQTNGRFDFAIQGDAFFLVESAEGERLTRAGSFTPSAEGELVNSDGQRLLDAGGAPIFVPFEAQSVSLASDGTLSADGTPIAQVGLFVPTDPAAVARNFGVQFASPGGLEPAEGATVLQGFVEGSNVDPIREIARMIEVQRNYEMGQKFMEAESERKSSVMRTLGR